MKTKYLPKHHIGKKHSPDALTGHTSTPVSLYQQWYPKFRAQVGVFMQIIVSNAEILVLIAPERPKVTGMILDLLDRNIKHYSKKSFVPVSLKSQFQKVWNFTFR